MVFGVFVVLYIYECCIHVTIYIQQYIIKIHLRKKMLFPKVHEILNPLEMDVGHFVM